MRWSDEPCDSNAFRYRPAVALSAMASPIHRMDAIRYYRDARHWDVEMVLSPSWTDVEAAVRRMDNYCFPIVQLNTTDDDENESIFNVVGVSDTGSLLPRIFRSAAVHRSSRWRCSFFARYCRGGGSVNDSAAKQRRDDPDSNGRAGGAQCRPLKIRALFGEGETMCVGHRDGVIACSDGIPRPPRRPLNGVMASGTNCSLRSGYCDFNGCRRDRAYHFRVQMEAWVVRG